MKFPTFILKCKATPRKYVSFVCRVYLPATAAALSVHRYVNKRFLAISQLFHISWCHFVTLSASGSDLLTCVSTHSFRPSDLLATRLVSTAQLLTFR